jgi:hypothetical protein
MPKLTLDDYDRNAFVRHFNRVGVPKLVGCEPPSHSCRAGGVVQSLPRRRRLPAASSGRSVDHAQHRADWELMTDLQPRIQLLPRPPAHPNLPALAALPAPNEYAAAGSVQIALLECEGFADSESGAPEQNDERAEPVALGAITDCAHDRDDLFDRRWVSRVLLALVARWTASVVAGHGRGRTAVAGDIQQHGSHESSLGRIGRCCCYSNHAVGTQGGPAATRRALLVSALSAAPRVAEGRPVQQRRQVCVGQRGSSTPGGVAPTPWLLQVDRSNQRVPEIRLLVPLHSRRVS